MAIDWTLPRTNGAYRFVRVDYTTRLEEEELTTITPGGSIVRNINTRLKEEGQLSAIGPLELGDDLVRVYYEPTDSAGEEASIQVGTLHAVNSRAIYGAATEGLDLVLYSALLTLEQTKTTTTLTLDAPDVAVDEAAALITSLGLPVTKTASTKELGVAWSWDPGTPYLDIVNDLLSYAGYWSAQVDRSGRVVLKPYQSPSERTPTWDFLEGSNSVFVPSVEVVTDAFDVPNQVIVVASNGAGVETGTYTNTDPLSPFSTVTRGRTISETVQVNDAEDSDDLDARAERELYQRTKSSETITIKHAYVPVYPGDIVRFQYPTRGLSLVGAIQSQTLALTAALPVTSVLKRVWGVS